MAECRASERGSSRGEWRKVRDLSMTVCSSSNSFERASRRTLGAVFVGCDCRLRRPRRLRKLRLGEALEFVVRHQQRHVQQALRVQATVELELAC